MSQWIFPFDLKLSKSIWVKSRTRNSKYFITAEILLSLYLLLAGGSRLGHSSHGARQDVPLGLRGSGSGGEHDDPDGVALLVRLNTAH